MTRKHSCTMTKWIFTILCIAVGFVTETTADKKQMSECNQAMTRKHSCTITKWIFTILCIAVEFVTETTADQKQMSECNQANSTIELLELK